MGKLDREKIKAYIQAAQEVEKKLEGCHADDGCADSHFIF